MCDAPGLEVRHPREGRGDDGPHMWDVGGRPNAGGVDGYVVSRGLEFQATCIRAGFGPVMHVKAAQSLAGVASYVVKYLHKTGAQRQVETDGSRVRTPNR